MATLVKDVSVGSGRQAVVALAFAFALASDLSAMAQWVDPPPFVSTAPSSGVAPSASPAKPDSNAATVEGSRAHVRPPKAPFSPLPNPSSAAGPQSDMAPLTPSNPQVPTLQPSKEPNPATADTALPPPTVQRPDRITAANQFAGRYLEYWSSTNAITRNAALAFYAPTVRFYGKLVDLDEVIGEKQRFVERWPERDYAVLPPTLQVTCDAANEECHLVGLFSFIAENPARGRRSSGTGRLELDLGFDGDRPFITAETSQVVGRGAAIEPSLGDVRN